MADRPSKSHGRLSIGATTQPRELVTDQPQLKGAWTARVITLFPEAFPGPLALSLTGKALDEGLWRIETVDLRSFGEGRHRNVDDTPAGGGAGMILRADVMGRAVTHAMRGTPQERARWPIIYLSPRGAPLSQDTVRALANTEGATLICGRFEGLDERVIEHFNVQEISIGDYILTGGELAAQVLVDAVVRLRPGVLGNARSAQDESFQTGLLEFPQYTRPAVWEGKPIPDVLTSGDHAKVAAWREFMSRQLTRTRRPDLWAAYAAEHGLEDDA